VTCSKGTYIGPLPRRRRRARLRRRARGVAQDRGGRVYAHRRRGRSQTSSGMARRFCARWTSALLGIRPSLWTPTRAGMPQWERVPRGRAGRPRPRLRTRRDVSDAWRGGKRPCEDGQIIF
jgi:hypothetical protein